MYFYSIITVNKITDLSIDFGLNYGLYSLYNRIGANVNRSLVLAA